MSAPRRPPPAPNGAQRPCPPAAARPGQTAGRSPSPKPPSITLPPEFVEAVALKVAEILSAREAPEPWIGVDAAARHLSCGRSRIYALVSANRIPHRKDGSRVLLRRSELDAWLADGGGIRP